MDNPKIFATGNENLSGDFNISYYIIEKEEKFFDWLDKLLSIALKSEKKESSKYIHRNIEDDQGSVIGEEVYLKNISKMIDVHEHYGNTNRIDLYYGKDRVFMTFRKSKEIRREITEFISKTKDWINVKETKELPVYAGEKIN